MVVILYITAVPALTCLLPARINDVVYAPGDDDADAFLESSAGIMIKGLHVQSGHVAEIRAELSSGKAKGL